MIDAYDDHDNQIAYLLKLAGRRPAPGAERMERAREAARAEWMRTCAVHRRRRTIVLLGVAATVALLGSVSVWQLSPRPGVQVVRPEVALVQRTAGSVTLAAADGGGSAPVQVAQRLRAGDRVVVAPDGRAAFEVAGGISVRLAAAAEVVFDAADRLTLARGAMYVDADPARRPGPLVVETSFGRVSHVGTQFELRVDDRSLGVRVREGAVAVDSRDGRVSAGAGEALRFSSNRPAERTRITTSGPEWAWVAALASPFALEGATVPAFLDWVSREQGWHWEYATASSRRLAERAVLHGSIDGLTPEEALLVVLPATGLTTTRRGDRLLIRVSGDR